MTPVIPAVPIEDALRVQHLLRIQHEERQRVLTAQHPDQVAQHVDTLLTATDELAELGEQLLRRRRGEAAKPNPTDGKGPSA